MDKGELMKLTKYAHACFTIEKDDQLLVVDPGNLSADFIAPERVIGVVVTHEHGDHFDLEQLAAIADKNPEMVIIAHESVTSKIEALETKTVSVVGDTLTVGAFNLEFFGGLHAPIHRSFPVVANLGIMINELLYYPGDSFTLPGKSVDTLALPAGAPWLKIGDAIDFLEQASPRFAFPTHDAVLSNEGKEINDQMLTIIAKKNNIIYKRLNSELTI